MNNTTFKIASGLPNRAQLTTARDIAKLSHALIQIFQKSINCLVKQNLLIRVRRTKHIIN